MSSATPTERTRQRLRHVALFVAFCFLLTVFFLLYWTIFRGPSILARDDNPRLIEQELSIQRGTISDRNGEVLAETLGTPGALERVYPNPEIGPAVGYYSDRYGTAGIEEGMDSQLRGERDNPWLGWWHNDLLHEAVVGRNVRITLDSHWQELADDMLVSQTGSILLFSIPDFAIRAMVSKPGYDPNLLDDKFEELAEDEQAPLLNRVTQGQYQPGLAIQPFVLSSALANGAISLDDTVAEVNRSVSINGYSFACEEPVEDQASWADVLQSRCPYPMTQLSSQLQDFDLLAAFDKFGLFSAPLLPITTVSADFQPILSEELAYIGQDQQAISPLQLASAWAILLNEGRQTQFTLVSAVQDDADQWQPWPGTSESEEVVPNWIVREIMQALPAKEGIRGHSALVLSGPEGGTNSWFMGTAPASDPRYGVVAVLENTMGEETAITIGQQLLKAVISGLTDGE